MVAAGADLCQWNQLHPDRQNAKSNTDSGRTRFISKNHRAIAAGKQF